MIAVSACLAGRACRYDGKANTVQALKAMVERGEAVPICPEVLGGLGIALSFRCGIFNFGGEGQFYLGAFAATWLGVNLTGLPFFIHIPICLLGSMVFGGLWALIPGWLKIKRGYNETITSVLLNYVGVYFVNYTLASFFRAEGVLNHQSPKIQTSAMLSKLMKGSELNTSLFLTLAIVILFYFIFYKTDVGFKLRMVGANAETARTSGVNTRKYLLLAIITSGALAGLAGSVQVMGYQHLMVQNFSPNTGYDIISVALMGNLHPSAWLWPASCWARCATAPASCRS